MLPGFLAAARADTGTGDCLEDGVRAISPFGELVDVPAGGTGDFLAPIVSLERCGVLLGAIGRRADDDIVDGCRARYD